MLRLEAFIEGFIYTIQINGLDAHSGGTSNKHGFCLENKNLFKNLNSLTSVLSTIYIRTYLG